MPTASLKILKSKVSASDASESSRTWHRQPKAESLKVLALCLVAGAVLALSAPGFGQWYLAWFALSPLFLFIYTSKTVWQATARGAAFGLGYHLVFLIWYTGIHPLSWIGIDDISSLVITSTCYLFETCHHTLLVAIFAAIAFALPVAVSFLPVKKNSPEKNAFEKSTPENNIQRWTFSTYLILPLLWVLCNNKIGNAYDLLGVPWAMLEYTQYKQLPIIQIASIIGGVGLEFLIVLTNVVAAIFIATFYFQTPVKQLKARSKESIAHVAMATAAGLTLIYIAGACIVVNSKFTPEVTVSILQNDRAKVKGDGELEDQVQAAKLAAYCPSGICVWPTAQFYFDENQTCRESFTKIADYIDSELIVGGLAREHHNRRTHAIYKFNSKGIGPTVYKKRYLVPFGEYVPASWRQLPILWDTDFGKAVVEQNNFVGGTEPTLIALKEGAVAPLICFEVVSPDCVSASVRNGGQLLLDIGDRTWFRGKFGWMMGEQMLAMAVLRAVENHRYFVYLVKTGPSVIIEPTGRLAKVAPFDKSGIVSGRVQFISKTSVFNKLQVLFSSWQGIIVR